MTTPRTPGTPRQLSLPEFIAMLAFLFAMVAFSIDAMLPALPQIADDLSPADPNRAQLVLTAFVAGMGAGTLFAGPISDAIGRKPAIGIGIGIYIASAVAAIYANSLGMLLVARFIQGLGVAGPRIVGLALVRDLYAGREMARITSFVMMIFIVVPAMAPLLGSVFIGWWGWRGVFAAFVGFGLVGLAWVQIRQAETLPAPARRPMRLSALWQGTREVLSSRQVVIATVVMTLGFGQMFALLSSAQQLFSETYGQGDRFPLWFAGMALLSGSGTVLNAIYVVRLGMRRIARAAYAMQVVVSAVVLALMVADALPENLRFALFFFWATSVFFMAGVTFGNLNALVLQDLGHIAGLAASVIAALSTLGAVIIAAPVGLMFDGTALPMVMATLICSALAWWLMRGLRDA
ncbi:MAG: multidrug effflux MFS transporter [Paracoccus sp. (in: a-proteobacteria)]|nr:multidrug effflux MFS transporter [Paracoccus sp. (in: a-proteobacteria)]